MNSFLNQNNKYEIDYKAHIDFFSDLELKEFPIKKSMPSELIITNININHGGFNMKFGPLLSNIIITIAWARTFSFGII